MFRPRIFAAAIIDEDDIIKVHEAGGMPFFFFSHGRWCWVNVV
jgi:hypothetical protein